jgi:Flp pilus assembly protein TadB
MKSSVSIDELHKEMDLIQSCITRMAQNSFMIKGWGFGLVAVLVALTANKISWSIICGIGVFMLLCFWVLDAFFLKMEKCYRFKYEWVIEQRPKGNRTFLYDLNPYNERTRKKGKKTPSVVSIMFSKPCTLLLFYGAPITIGLLVIVLGLLNVI